ncbi:calcium-responsive transcription factor-like isoform X2 [Centruroides vittatus]|uniref:calcium-responsive transcription factor-like isoform X2 n=1 Tax=Centruroides vittatus TaxID=120091 RepID=UPI00350F93A4
MADDETINNLTVVGMDVKQETSEITTTAECPPESILQTAIQSTLPSGTTFQPVHIVQTQEGTVLTADSLDALNGVVISVGAPEVQSQQYCGKVWQVVQPSVNSGITHIIHLSPEEVTTKTEEKPVEETSCEINQVECKSEKQDIITSLLLSPSLQNSSIDAPQWALRMRDCEHIGDSYRGWVSSEVELDLLLAYHKQETQSFWGTRQSTGVHRNSLRLMWKSQYVPFDGIPFINAGSRAVVMECQYGPRRKGSSWKKPTEGLQKGEFKQTCPARIYIKKVRKFPEYQVNLTLDKKSLRAAMEKAFLDLKSSGFEGHGEDRWYIQLPTELAHEFHEGPPSGRTSSRRASHTQHQPTMETEIKTEIPSCSKRLSRIHPQLVEKIRDLVSHGEVRVFAIRKQLRKFVEREMFQSQESLPERHNLCYFPTIHDIQNHICEALKDIRLGSLPLLAPSLNIEVQGQKQEDISDESSVINIASTGEPHLQTITVTLSRSIEPGQAPVISRIEAHLSDGSTRVSSTLTPETFELLSRLHPSVFPPGSLIQLAETNQTCPTEVTQTQLTPVCPSDAEFCIIPQQSNSTNCKMDAKDSLPKTLTIERNDQVMTETPIQICEINLQDIGATISRPVISGLENS